MIENDASFQDTEIMRRESKQTKKKIDKMYKKERVDDGKFKDRIKGN